MEKSMLNRTLILTAAMATAASAQTTLYTYHGQMGDGLGGVIADAGDIDGDGVRDFLLSAMGETSFGTVRLYSGATGALIYAVHCPVATNQFGSDLANLGDIDFDGVPDFAVGNANGEPIPNATGSVRVFSGATGTHLYALFGSSSPSWFGSAIASIGDLDGDSAPDFIVGAKADSSLNPGDGSSGTARLFSGASGALLHTITGGVPFESATGFGVAGLGDVDGDLVPDFAVSSWGYNIPPQSGSLGRVRVFSGATFALLYDVVGPEPERGFGTALESVGDVDGDGIRDFVVGAPGTFAPVVPGAAYLHSGATGALLHSFFGDSNDDRFGFPADLGDIDGDGTSDVAIAARIGKYAKVYSGASGAWLYTMRETYLPSMTSFAVAGLGDLDGDGRPEIGIGSVADSLNGTFSGRARIVSDGTTPPAGSISCAGDGSAGACPCGNFGAADAGCANSTGAGAALQGVGTTSVAEDLFFLAGEGLPTQTLTVLFSGTASSPTSLAFAGAGLRCIGGTLRRVATRSANQSGMIWLGPTLQPAGGWSGGETRHFQAFYRNPIGPCGAVFNVSNAVSVLFTP